MNNDNWLLEQAQSVQSVYDSMEDSARDLIESQSASSAHLKEQSK